ncbi:MAG TPA: NAD(P)H-binding protein [Gaiellaceae bacterium]
MPIFLTGATGYVGGRLLEALLARGDEVRALTRDASRLQRDGVEVVEGDVRDDVSAALADVDVAYYLVHSLGSDDFGGADREAAQAFAESARAADVGRIVYLGGLGRGDLSPHLASRQEVGKLLRESGVPTIELRASVVIGEGSVSYDTFTTLAQLPLAVLPDWIDTPSQPIAIDDVVAYLVEAADVELDGSAVYEIGGADVVPYRAILEAVGGSAVTLPAPSLVADLATVLKPLQPERARVVSDLLDSLRVDTSVHDDAALRAFSVRPRGLAEAVSQ